MAADVVLVGLLALTGLALRLSGCGTLAYLPTACEVHAAGVVLRSLPKFSRSQRHSSVPDAFQAQGIVDMHKESTPHSMSRFHGGMQFFRE